MITYRVGDHTYEFSYRELATDYRRFVAMSDEEFMNNILKILHFACYVCFIKEKNYHVLGDEGIIHSLVHLSIPHIANCIPLNTVRELFKKECELP